ncbi:MAG: hypothetical protein A2600_03205 [Candidatus Lambdaproteobacteria bacterium RIFOXYD1_FULL_56_27]|uniref:Outer membrane lipoprotein BamD-like domain-containing protein n=1 Tax=Candidatus Lambdaproteobacteria bacterium RIFOXYD2_FULL_56_26 TaxID=1817773 RepID=A0A1F6H328_9PROT|nr:MAG: hypothetical protein A2557_07270 [Candidatus Lambdaproteobacteria bacterium RIFOXYD2_FULL_56_26]OGH05400.1 MAG: hypothetical protein A2426_05595 [Candidatus Lambdaproteobacteria bacterium RIFOXYC1_FULL_56_13]OGH09244.1 MAG: hypothetical protein A2600_03205 [Candidatus Lambdaproteobacteria bacterium RIFOXYD1_FULL_56_27]
MPPSQSFAPYGRIKDKTTVEETMLPKTKPWIGLLLFGFLAGCSESVPKTVEQKYDLAIEYMDKAQYAQATPILLEVIDENPGTRFATFSHLKLGDAWMSSGDTEDNFNSAEIQYRIFLKDSPSSHLVPYVLNRLIELNYRRNISLFFNETYAFSRDPGHFRKIIKEYQRFFLLYPGSLYRQDSVEYLAKAERALAKHEFLIGRWYLDHQLYPSAIARFQNTLQVYPNFEDRQEVLAQLIEAYSFNQQPERAKEMQRIYDQHFK